MLGTGKILFNFLKKHKVIVYYYESEKSEVTQSCTTLCDPMGCSLPAFSVHGIFQARILEWVAISFSRRSSRPRDWTKVSHIVGYIFLENEIEAWKRLRVTELKNKWFKWASNSKDSAHTHAP